MPKAWKTRRFSRFNDALGVEVYVRLERETGKLPFPSITGRKFLVSLSQVALAGHHETDG